MDPFLETHAVILVADHAQTDVTEAYELVAELEREWRVLEALVRHARDGRARRSPGARAGQVYVLVSPDREAACHADVRARLEALEGTDLVAWLARPDGSPSSRAPRGSPVADDRASKPWSRPSAASCASAPAARAKWTAAASAGTSTAPWTRSG